jgi:phosphoribosyl-ATP pyrophosphohydrolase/phosphoribosyl-AMP cyclohydrolase
MEKSWDIFFEKGELIPAIVQDVESGKVLMMAYLNREALSRTLETGKTWFYSRSRGKLWNKGEQSGHFQEVQGIYVDCDNDTLLIQVKQEGVACHTGFFSCFHRELKKEEISEPQNQLPPYSLSSFLQELFEIVEERAMNPSPQSYTSRLLEEGREKILRKVAEEATEVILAALENEDSNREHLHGK